jgi:chaperonin GroEL
MKQIDFSTKEKIVSSVTKLADAVGSTLGAGGRNVMVQFGNQFAITKDGVTVARQIEFEDDSENAVAQIVKEAAARTARDAGDGTTTSTILVYEIVKSIMEREDFDSLNVTKLRRGIEDAAKHIVEEAKKHKKEITSDEELKSIATISGNNDKEIGEMMLKVYAEVGKNGAVRLEETSSNKTTIDVAEGCYMEAGYITPHFSNNTTKRIADYKDPVILVTDKKFENSFSELVPALEAMLNEGKPAIIICGGMEGEPLGTLLNNKIQKQLPIVAIQAPYFGSERDDILADVAAATGATVVSEALGFSLDEIKPEMLGHADRIVVDGFSTVIYGRKGDEKAIADRVESIKNQQEEDRDGSMAFRLNQRLASMTSGVGVIYVGGKSEAEMKDMYYRLEDSLSATKAALVSGYVIGGGMAYYNAAKALPKMPNFSDSYAIGYTAMIKAAQAPVKWIIKNSGGSFEVYEKELGKKGYNAVTCELDDLEKSGIIDPFQVLDSAVGNAASVAAMLITTNVIITDERRRK